LANSTVAQQEQVMSKLNIPKDGGGSLPERFYAVISLHGAKIQQAMTSSLLPHSKTDEFPIV